MHWVGSIDAKPQSFERELHFEKLHCLLFRTVGSCTNFALDLCLLQLNFEKRFLNKLCGVPLYEQGITKQPEELPVCVIVGDTNELPPMTSSTSIRSSLLLHVIVQQTFLSTRVRQRVSIMHS